jgi:hypothetical protein
VVVGGYHQQAAMRSAAVDEVVADCHPRLTVASVVAGCRLSGTEDDMAARGLRPLRAKTLQLLRWIVSFGSSLLVNVHES